MSIKDAGFKLRPEAATRSDSLYLFGEGILFLSGKSMGILKSEVCCNNDTSRFLEVKRCYFIVVKWL